MSILPAYMRAWAAAEPEDIAALVTEDCVITECYGPVYRGRDRVRQWAQQWFAAGGIVHRWELTDHVVTADREVAAWTFSCTWQGTRATFDGASLSRVEDGLIVEMREYETSAPLYDWHGSWR